MVKMVKMTLPEGSALETTLLACKPCFFIVFYRHFLLLAAFRPASPLTDHASFSRFTGISCFWPPSGLPGLILTMLLSREIRISAILTMLLSLKIRISGIQTMLLSRDIPIFKPYFTYTSPILSYLHPSSLPGLPSGSLWQPSGLPGMRASTARPPSLDPAKAQYF